MSSAVHAVDPTLLDGYKEKVTATPAQHSDRSPRRIVVIGASAGGVQALMALVSELDPELDAAVLVVLHVSPNGRSVLPDILSRAGPLRAAHPRDFEPLVSGFVYVAPPDRHLLLNDDTIRVTGGPWENGHRPSIDVLFRSAARWHGAHVIAVVLSGALDDGAAGVAAVAEQGGTVLVQDPHEAEVPEMPSRALETVPDATIGSLAQIAARINSLTREAPPRTRRRVRPLYADEVRVAEGARRSPEALGEQPAGLVCPDCNGSLFEVSDERVLRYRCRVGHAWTADALAGTNGRDLEEALWVALRILEEDAVVRDRLMARARSRGRNRTAARYEEIRTEREKLMESVRDALSRATDTELEPSALEQADGEPVE